MKKLIAIFLMMLFVSNAFAALTSTVKKQFTVGDLRGVIYEVSYASVTGGATYTGWRNLIACFYSPETSDDHGNIYLNSASASATEDDPGVVYVDGVTSDDIGKLFCLGN